MNGLVSLFAVLATLASSAQAASDDVIMQSRLDQKTMSWLIEKTKLILDNSGTPDVFTDTIQVTDEPIIALDELNTDPKFQKIRDRLVKVFKVDIKNAFLRIRVPKVYYHLLNLSARLKSISVKDPVLSLEATALLHGLDIALVNGMEADVMLMNPSTKKLEAYLTAGIKPISVSFPTTLPPPQFDVSLDATRGQDFSFNLKSYNLDPLPIYVRDHLSELIVRMTSSGAPLGLDDIMINPVTINLSGMSRTLNFDDFKPLLRKKFDLILGQVLGIVGDTVKTGIGPSVLAGIFSSHIRSDLSLSNDSIYSHFITSQFLAPAPDQLTLDVSSDLCTQALFNQYQQACVSHMETVEPVRVIDEADRQKAKDEVTAQIESGQVDATVSVSEEYLNRVLRTSIDAKLWDSLLQPDHLQLGPKGAFLVLDEATRTPNLYLDLIYFGSGQGVESVFINARHPIHFPIRMSTSLRFESRNGTPWMTINTEKLMSDSNEIINGLPQYGLSSDLVWGLKKKIAKMIVKMALKLEGTKAIEMEIPVFKGLGLEKTWYETSAYGRLNLYFKI